MYYFEILKGDFKIILNYLSMNKFSRDNLKWLKK